MAIRRRTVTARKIVGKKAVKDRIYQYEYYTLPLNLYLPKSMIEKWGTEFVIERDEEKGKIVIYSTKSTEK
ncbi:MAG: hypothetical protein QN229_02885 [Desulfurococcaceae archaeon TW002]